MVIPSPTWSSQSAWSVMFLTLVSYEDVINGMKTKPVYSLLCSPVSTTIIDTAYYTNISSEVCGTNCQPLKGGNCYTYGDGLCGLLLSPSDVSLLYRNCYSDNATCGHETFSAMSRKESISLLFLCSTGEALDPCEPLSGESTVLFRNFGVLDPLCNTSCTCDVEVPHLVEGGSLQVTYLMFSDLENSGRASINASLSLPGLSEVFLNVSTYPVTQHLPVVTHTLTFSVTLHISGQEDPSARFWLRFEKRARIVCYGSRHPSSTEVYPDIQHEVKHDGENDEPLWTSAGIAAIVAGLSAVAVTIGLVICATKRCVFFRPRKKLSLCLQHLTTLSTDTGVSQTGVSVEYQVDTSTTDTSVYVHHTH